MLTPPRHLIPYSAYTSGICRGPCKPDFYCGAFHLSDLDTDLDCRYSVYFTGHTDFDCGLFCLHDLDTLILTIEFCALKGAHGGYDRSTGDDYSLTPDPTSGFSRGLCLLNLYETDYSSLYYFFHSDGKKRWQFSVKDGDIHKLSIILNLEFWNFNPEAQAGQTSEYWIELAKDPKGYKMQVEKVPLLIF
jgi:hypothetical protein